MTPGSGERTLPALFEESVSKFPDHPFLLEKIDGKYRLLTYRETREYVLRFAAGLVSMGIRRGDRIALVAEGRALWVIAALYRRTL
jgi:long-chain acyl-CoA synthetase